MVWQVSTSVIRLHIFARISFTYLCLDSNSYTLVANIGTNLCFKIPLTVGQKSTYFHQIQVIEIYKMMNGIILIGTLLTLFKICSIITNDLKNIFQDCTHYQNRWLCVTQIVMAWFGFPAIDEVCNIVFFDLLSWIDSTPSKFMKIISFHSSTHFIVEKVKHGII